MPRSDKYTTEWKGMVVGFDVSLSEFLGIGAAVNGMI
jgi:RNA polymerase subunit RPABC4/transcription elongation factor Spt4